MIIFENLLAYDDSIAIMGELSQNFSESASSISDTTGQIKTVQT